MTAFDQIFSWKRFTAALRKEFVENWLKFTLIVLALYLIFTLVFTMANLLDYNYKGVAFVFKDNMQLLRFFVLGMIVANAWAVFAAIMASMAFRHLTSKTGRTDLFTNPTSMTEKYAVNLIIYVIGAFVALIACGYLADLTRYGILTLFGAAGREIIPPVSILSTWLTSENGVLWFEHGFGSSDMIYMSLVSLIAAPAFYFLGSVLWPKWSLVKSFIAERVISATLMGITLLAFAVPFEKFRFGEYAINIDGFNVYDTLLVKNCIILALAIICWLGSWYLFKRKDIVSLKWWK